MKKIIFESIETLFSRDYEIYNPLNKDTKELPYIFGFNNGVSFGNYYEGCLISQNGYFLGGHICSSENFMYGDLGVIKNSRKDRHEESFKKHYPNGYKMIFIPYDKVPLIKEIQEAFILNKTLNTKEKNK